jgi:hypothetical protein
MKVWFFAVIAVIVGVGLGLGNVWLEFSTVRDQFAPHNQPPGVRVPDRPVPKAIVVGGPDYDFGVGTRNGQMRHNFVVRNDGDGPLTLERGSTSCKCTLSELKTGQLAPGETAEVTLEWKITAMGEMFRQTAEIHTNDPVKPTIVLSIHGTIMDLVRLDPQDLVLTSIPADECASARFHLFGFKIPTLNVTAHEFTNKDTASHFEVAFAPVSAEELQKHTGATCGVTGTVTVKPGLPLGAINQTIRLTTDIEQARTFDLSIAGRVVSDIAIVASPRFNDERKVLQFGTVKRATGISETLRVLVKGPHRHEVTLAVREVDPADVLAVHLGEAKSINNGAVFMYPLTVEVPKDARPIDRLGSAHAKYGHIVIETNHPTIKEVAIRVKFAVE